MSDYPSPRQHPRAEWRAPVQIVGGEQPLAATSVNVSVGGMLVATDAKLRVGDAVRARFRLPTMSADTEADAVVRWTADGVAGLSFVGLRAIEVRAIHRLTR